MMKISTIYNNNRAFGQFTFHDGIQKDVSRKLRTKRQWQRFEKIVNDEKTNPRDIRIGCSIGFYAYENNEPISAGISKNIFETLPQFFTTSYKEI